MPHKPKLPRSRCFYPAFNQSWAIHHVHIVLNNSETMLVSLVLHFNGKKKNHMSIVQACQGCLAALLKLPKHRKNNHVKNSSYDVATAL